MEFMQNDPVGRTFWNDLKGDINKQRLDGYVLRGNHIELAGHAVDGVPFIDDMIRISENYGTWETWPSNREFVEIEQYRVFKPELIESVLLSLLAVAIVVAFITVNLHLSMLILLSVCLVDFFLVALIYFWGMTMNMFTGIAMVIALGIAVDYSTHIAHTYLMARPPTDCKTNREKRHYKAKKAISQMGSSVFHAAFSSFLALIPLAFAESYHFLVFFRTWTGITIFGFLNGLVFLPALMSEIGPLVSHDTDSKNEQEEPNQHD